MKFFKEVWENLKFTWKYVKEQKLSIIGFGICNIISIIICVIVPIISAKIIPIKSCTKGCSSGRKISMELEAPIADASNCLNREMW